MIKKNLGTLDCFIIETDTGEKPKHAVILLHGYGADGKDLISLGNDWKDFLPETVFIAPNAPDICDDTPFGRQWFPLNRFTKDAMLEQMMAIAPKISKHIEDIIDHYSVPPSRVTLCGFSQGCMLALEIALTAENPYAGLLGYSGMLLNDDMASLTNKETLIHMIHGTADMVIPSSEWNHTTKSLTEAGYQVSGYKTKGLAHGIDREGIDSGKHFIKMCSAEKSSAI